MEASWLEDFLSVIDCGGFSRAAERQGVSQPAFSRRIKALETWAGATLFDRGTHTVRLTGAGERFRSMAQETLRRLELGRDEVRTAARNSSNTLRFASTHVLSLTFFPRWLLAIERSAPIAAAVELTAENMAACERMMLRGRAQFLLCHHHDAAPSKLGADFISVRLGTDRLIAVAAPGIVERGDASHLAFTSTSGMGRILAATRRHRENRSESAPAFSSHLASVLTAMARDGRGVAWCPLSLIDGDLRDGRLVRVHPAMEDVVIEIRLFRPQGRQSVTVESFWQRVSSVSA